MNVLMIVAATLFSISDLGELEKAVKNHKEPNVDVFTLTGVIGKGDHCVAFHAHAGNPQVATYAVLFPKSREYHGNILSKARTLEKLGDNPDIARFVFQDTYRGMPFLVEEYGRPLSKVIEIISAHGVQPDLGVFKVFIRDLLTVLDNLHQKGYVHGDIHPGNIIMCKGMKLKLIDIEFIVSGVAISNGFSSGRYGESSAPPEGLSSGQESSGNLYAPPEIKGDCKVSTSFDIYSAGAICFAFLTGRPPKRGEWSIRKIRPDLPEWPSSLLASMVQRHPNRPSAYQLLSWLDGYQRSDKAA